MRRDDERSDDRRDHPEHASAGSDHRSCGGYTPPALRVLGTLTDLTLGGIDGADSDGFGTTGDEGSIA